MNPEDGGKISDNASGLGVASPKQVRQRAREIALADGRTGDDFSEADYERARAELLGVAELPNDVEPATAELTEWDTRATADGWKIPNQSPSDEANIAQKLVEEGVDEAVRDEMRAAGESESS
jgi:hypothetical protein